MKYIKCLVAQKDANYDAERLEVWVPALRAYYGTETTWGIVTHITQEEKEL